MQLRTLKRIVHDILLNREKSVDKTFKNEDKELTICGKNSEILWRKLLMDSQNEMSSVQYTQLAFGIMKENVFNIESSIQVYIQIFVFELVHIDVYIVFKKIILPPGPI